MLVHVPNSGRLGELMAPGTQCLLTEARSKNAARKTAYDITLVRHRNGWVCVDARLPNRLLAEAVEHGSVAEFAGMRVVRAEVTYGGSRLDLLLEGPDGQCIVETKCATLVRDGVALFPDAPTERGRRHLETLAQAVQDGLRAAVVFMVQRGDAVALAPNDATDAAFGEALRLARAHGVEVLAYGCRVSKRAIMVDAPLPVCL